VIVLIIVILKSMILPFSVDFNTKIFFCFVNSLPLEKRSFREYVSILYTDPRMKIYISGSKVRTKNLFHTLYLPYEYEYTAKNIFKRKAEMDIDEVTVELQEGTLPFYLVS
jgi:hypothetical protein